MLYLNFHLFIYLFFCTSNSIIPLSFRFHYYWNRFGLAVCVCVRESSNAQKKWMWKWTDNSNILLYIFTSSPSSEIKSWRFHSMLIGRFLFSSRLALFYFQIAEFNPFKQLYWFYSFIQYNHSFFCVFSFSFCDFSIFIARWMKFNDSSTTSNHTKWLSQQQRH